MGFQARLLAPGVETGCFQGKMDFFNEASVFGRMADKKFHWQLKTAPGLAALSEN